jgi:hypothetical protein
MAPSSRGYILQLQSPELKLQPHKKKKKKTKIKEPV